MDIGSRDDELDWTLLARYFAGECSAAERAEVARWSASAPGRAEELRMLERWWTTSANVPSVARVDAMWGTLAARMHTDAAPAVRPSAVRESVPHHVPHHAPYPTPRAARSFSLAAHAARRDAGRGWRRAAGALAASLALVAAGTLAVRARTLAPASTTEAPLREFATGRGQRATISLIDGTRVELGFGSRLRVRPFDGARREMYLEGEAVFDVVHDARRPFLVHAANAVTEDLGTVFAVRAYPGAEAVNVVVISGRVALRARDAAAGAPATELGRGQLGRLDAAGRVDVTSDVDTAAWTSWLGNRAVFHDAALSDVAAELSRRFDVDVRVPDAAVAARRVTIDMPARSLTDVLDAATVPLGLRHRREGRVILLER